MRRFLARFANLFHRGRAESRMTREIDAHLALIAEDYERSGMPPAEAALAARRAYGGVEQSKELHRDARTFVWIEQLLKDIHYAWRNLVRTPGFTLVAALALTLGLGVNFTIFAVYNALVLKPLRVAHPDRVVRLKRWFQQHQGDDQFRFSLPEYRYLTGRTGTFSGVVATYGDFETTSGGMTVLASIGGSAVREHLLGRAVSANYFAVLGEKPLLGRFFRPEEDRAAGANPVVVLTWRCWRQRFQGDPGAVGQSVKLNGLPYTMVGVAPQSFTGTDLVPFEFDFWAPLSMVGPLDAASAGANPSARAYQVLARLQDGVSRSQAQAETSLTFRQFLASDRQADPTTAITLERTRYLDMDSPEDRAGFQWASAAMWIVVCLVLVAACANVANMLLARGASRQREIGIRLAMGAGRARVVRQLLLESLLLSVLGGLAAIPLSVIAGRSLFVSLTAIFRTVNLKMTDPDFSPDSHLLAYGTLLSIVTAILFGLAPALRFTRFELNRVMKEDGGIFITRFARSHLRAVLLATQAAVSLLLLLVSGVIMKEFHDATAFNLGFDAHNTYVLEAEGQEQGHIDLWALRSRIANLPEIAATAIAEAPSGGDDGTLPVKAGKWDRPMFASAVSDGYFETVGMRFERGRGFTRQEIDDHSAVAVITASTARRCWPNEDPLGKPLSLMIAAEKSKAQTADVEVIGVVNDVRQADLIKIDPVRVYIPKSSSATPASDLLFRIRTDRARAFAAVQAAVESADPKLLPGLKLYSVEDGNIAAIRVFYRSVAAVAGILTLLAVTLAVVGIYGVMAFLVSQRTREIGIRIALGATARALLKAVALQGLRPVAIGMAFGFAAALALDAWYRSTDLLPETMVHRLFGSPMVCVEVALMLVVAALAGVIPARRALGVDPVRALRHE